MAKYLEYEVEEDSGKKPKTLEDVLELIGGFGWFQFFSLIFILFYEIPVGMLAFLMIFVGRTPKEWQCIAGNTTILMDADEICTCNGTRFSEETTIVTEWNLICDKSWVVDTITTLQMCGMFIGNTVPPQISDWLLKQNITSMSFILKAIWVYIKVGLYGLLSRYGRKRTFIGLILTMSLGQAASALSVNPYIFAISRFICGIGHAGYMTINGIYSMEFLTPKWRQLAGCLGPLGEGIMILAMLAYAIQQWRLLIWATASPFLTIIPFGLFLRESPRWLLKQKRIPEAERVIRYIAKVNRKQIENVDVILKQVAAQEEKTSGTVRFSYVDLFKRKEFRKKTIVFIGIWFCWALQYYGIKFNVKNFGVSPYLMLMLLGGADCIGFRAALLVNNRLGRRTALVLFSSVSAAFFLSLAFIQIFFGLDDLNTLFIVFVLLGKLGVAGGRSSIRCLTVESYPVSIRTMGFGTARIAAAFGGIAAPQLAYIGTKWPSIPLFTFATLGMTGSLISLLLTETSGKPLQDDIKDGKTDMSGRERKKGRLGKKGKRKVVPVDMNGQPVNAQMKYGEVVTVESILATDENTKKLVGPSVLLKRSKSF